MARTQKIQFANSAGELLAAALTLPSHAPRAFVLFAHCFTCGKDIAAASRIARTLAANRFAVLRFDFTGLGSSQGDFANSNFTSNVQDLLSAANYLRDNHQAPALLVGHSLGGTAVLAAASDVPECKAVVTIGAPASPEHVIRQFSESRDLIEAEGEAVVSLAGRDFRIRKQFLDDLRAQPLTEQVSRLRRALLVFHAPLDNVVSVDEAGKLFLAARHPKSFVSLDGADHLLSKVADAQYVADTLTAWVQRYLPASDEARPDVAGGEILVSELDHKFLLQIASDDHGWLADEPKRVGGGNQGPDPYEHLLAALGACTAMTIRMYANRKKWPLGDVDVQLEHSREHAKDCEDCEQPGAKVETLTRRVSLQGALTSEQYDRLMEIADRCPVHRTLEGDLRIATTGRLVQG